MFYLCPLTKQCHGTSYKTNHNIAVLPIVMHIKISDTKNNDISNKGKLYRFNKKTNLLNINNTSQD